ncbi:MAG: ChaN family lipoprotein [Puniceicoccales bacterium]
METQPKAETQAITEPSAPAAGPDWVTYQDGKESNWETLSARVTQADVILIGEQHDNALAHELELKLVETVLTHTPNAAVAMEMFERDEQTIVDFYTQGKISDKALFEATDSKSWGGNEDNWRAWYLPVVDAVRHHQAHGARLITANTPRAYVKLARIEDHAVLTAIAAQSPEERFVTPDAEVDDTAYRDRFFALMGGHGHGHGHGHAMDTSGFFRAQQLWDATMADAVLDAHASHPKVVLLVGDFHIASEGGLAQRVRHAAPGLDVITVSIIRQEDPTTFDEDDKDRADFVIYTR